MGGGALKNLPKGKETRRYQKEEFDTLANALLPKIKKIFKTKIELVQSYKNKQTFGDMDILVYNNGFSIDVENLPDDTNFSNEIKKLIQELNPNEIHKNGNVYSFDYKQLQIDLIIVEKDNWESSKIFYKWGDLGNFMGKLFNSYGSLNDGDIILKYGFDGIKSKLIYKHKKKEVFLSKDNKKMFDFLGLDFNKFKEGLKTNKEVFEFITTSKFYSNRVFQWDNLNNTNRERNRRRKDYYLFLEYINSKYKKNIEYNKSKDYYLNEIKDFFEVDLKEEYKKNKEEVDLHKKINSKFNGRHILGNFDVSPKSLNKLIYKFREEITNKYKNYNNFILENSVDIILEKFKQINEL